jgi:hypothetical protein
MVLLSVPSDGDLAGFGDIVTDWRIVVKENPSDTGES